MKKLKIISSWDDGDGYDLTLADMLIKYKIPAVFYIPIKVRDLTDRKVRQLAGTEPDCDFCKNSRTLFEIGGHSINHPESMRNLNDNDANIEVAGSKAGLEKIIREGTDKNYVVDKFCYPSGRYDDRIKSIVKRCGFKEARTVHSGSIEFPKDNFAIRPTVHVHPQKDYDGLTWKEFAEYSLDKVLENGGRFEIWGHSWEIEKFNMWEFLDDFLWYMDKKMEEVGYPRKARIPYFKIK